MKILLDTHLLLWAAARSERLSEAARTLLQDASSELHFSVINIWEVAIKFSLQRTDFRMHPQILRRALLDNGYKELVLNGNHAAYVAELPRLHNDPFDRILIAQASVEGMILLTSDTKISAYSGPIRLV